MEFTSDTISRFHHLANIFPLMTDEEFAGLCASIEKNGLLQPIWVYQDEIIDGRNRYYACLETGTELRFRRWNGDGSLINFIIGLNLDRRHLNESQRAMVAARLANMRSGTRTDLAPIGTRSDDAPENKYVSQSEAAAMLNVSRRSLTRAAKVQKNAYPKIAEQVEQGEISVSRAEKISALPIERQKQIAKRGGKALVDKKSRTKIKKIISKARSISDLCLLCNPEIEITDESFIVFLRALKVRTGARYGRYCQAMIEDIQDSQIAGQTDQIYDSLLEAIDSGLHTLSELGKATGFEKEILLHLLELMADNNIVEPVTQGGKTAMARGSRKTLWMRVPEAAAPSEDELDDFIANLAAEF